MEKQKTSDELIRPDSLQFDWDELLRAFESAAKTAHCRGDKWCSGDFDECEHCAEWRKIIAKAKANAHLIAAAPDLLEALDHPGLYELLGEIEDYGSEHLWSLAKLWMEIRDAALIKAKGGAQ